MCTIGALVTVKPERAVYLLKNADAWRSIEMAHTVERGASGIWRIVFRFVPQMGVNSGLNEHGLGVLISYSDYRLRDPEVHPPDDRAPATFARIDREPRTLMNELVLDTCRTVDEAVETMQAFVVGHPDMVGGNHLVADASGAVAVLEHCEGKSAIEYATDRGFAARANDSALLIREAQERLSNIGDSHERHAQMARCLQTARPDGLDSLRAARSILASHGPSGPDQMGSICVHGLTVRGCRTPAVGPHTCEPVWTVTSMVIDLTRREMAFTRGNPCQAPWHTLAL
jgi:hypothetical protein